MARHEVAALHLSLTQVLQIQLHSFYSEDPSIAPHEVSCIPFGLYSE